MEEADEITAEFASDEATIVIAALEEDGETPTKSKAAAPKALKPKKALTKVPTAKAPKLSLVVTPNKTENLPSAVVETVENESPRS